MNSLASIYKKNGTLGILLLLIVLFGVLDPQNFLTGSNFFQILLQSSIIILTACAMFFPLLIAGIDISIGSILACSGLVTAKLLAFGLPTLPSLLIGGLVVGGGLGAINGVIVAQTKLHPFIITLGTQSIFRGLVLLTSNARPVYGLPSSFTQSIGGYTGWMPNPVLYTLLIVIVLWYISRFTVFGRNLYAIGGNQNSAYLAGIPVKLHIFLVFIISGMLSGFAGVLTTARLGAAEPLAGQGAEIFAIAGAIIGGTSFFGGIGAIPKVLVGGIIIGLIQNGLNILSVPTFYQIILMGTLIIFSVIIDSALQKKAK